MAITLLQGKRLPPAQPNPEFGKRPARRRRRSLPQNPALPPLRTPDASPRGSLTREALQRWVRAVNVRAPERPAREDLRDQTCTVGKWHDQFLFGLDKDFLLERDSPLTSLPPGLFIDGDACLSASRLQRLDGLFAKGRVFAYRCAQLHSVVGLRALSASLFENDRLTQLDAIFCQETLDLSHCARLTQLPQELQAGHLILRTCEGLQELPRHYKRWPPTASGKARVIDIRGTAIARSWQPSPSVTIRRD